GHTAQIAPGMREHGHALCPHSGLVQKKSERERWINAVVGRHVVDLLPLSLHGGVIRGQDLVDPCYRECWLAQDRVRRRLADCREASQARREGGRGEPGKVERGGTRQSHRGRIPADDDEQMPALPGFWWPAHDNGSASIGRGDDLVERKRWCRRIEAEA